MTNRSPERRLRTAPHRRYPLLHLSAGMLAMALRVVPRRHRFAFALRLARLLTPLMRKTATHREHRQHRVDGSPEIALYRVLDALTTWGTRFEPRLYLDEGTELKSLHSKGRGLLIVSPHAMLGTLIPRYLYDLRIPHAIVAVDSGMRISGTRVPATILVPSRTSMIGIAKRLRGGQTVLAAIDRGDPSERRAIRFDTADGPAQVSGALIKVAVLCEADVAFMAVRLGDRGPVVSLRAPNEASLGSADLITRDFITFLQDHVARVVARSPATRRDRSAGRHGSALMAANSVVAPRPKRRTGRERP
jgi:lauroyl/myristoyl acyltransferase